MRSNAGQKRRLKKLEDAAGPLEPRKRFHVIDDQARVDELKRQHPDAFIIHHVIVDPPIRDADGNRVAGGEIGPSVECGRDCSDAFVSIAG